MKRLVGFFASYTELGIVIALTTVALLLYVAGQKSTANLILAVTSLAAALPLVKGMVATIRDGQYGVDILAVVAIVTSVILREYWAAVVIVIMLTSGRTLEDYAGRRARSELSSLLNLKPKRAQILRGRKVISVAASAVKAGDKIVVKPGDLIPVDAVVIDGSASVDESSLTGESIPVDKIVGSDLLSGSINLDGSLIARALRPASESQYEQIIKLVKSASGSQSPFVRLADRYSIPFTLISFGIGGIVWIVSGDAIRFLEVLVVATPCPLLLGAPIALISGMSRAAKHGIIVKSGAALERLAEIKTIGFDKTGTLTVGRPTLEEIYAFRPFSNNEILTAAAALEHHSKHVLAEAIVKEAKSRKLKIPKISDFKEHAGHGLTAIVEGKKVVAGKYAYVKAHTSAIPPSISKRLPEHTATYVSIDGKLAGYVTFIDEVRSESAATIRDLRMRGIKHILMVTGDNSKTAHGIADQLGIRDVRANCLPVDKLHAIQKEPLKPVAFVGDGVNDAPVLTAADVGIALGARGSAAASESADVVIMLDNVNKVATSVNIAKRTFSIARQSILLGIFISIGLMLIFATGRFKPVYGALIQELVDVAVILNALRAHGSWAKPGSKLLSQSVPVQH